METFLQMESLLNVLTIGVLYLTLTVLFQTIEVVFCIKRRNDGMAKLGFQLITGSLCHMPATSCHICILAISFRILLL